MLGVLPFHYLKALLNYNSMMDFSPVVHILYVCLLFLSLCVHTHTHIDVYVCVCVCVRFLLAFSFDS